MLSPAAQSIRSARKALGLTQEQLGRRLGVKARAVYRWERDANGLSKHHRSALIAAISVLDQGVAAQLSAALSGATAASPPQPTLAPATSALDAAVTLDLAVLAMADELDVVPRRVRKSLLRLCKRMRLAHKTLEALQLQLEASLLESAGDADT